MTDEFLVHENRDRPEVLEQLMVAIARAGVDLRLCGREPRLGECGLALTNAGSSSESGWSASMNAGSSSESAVDSKRRSAIEPIAPHRPIGFRDQIVAEQPRLFARGFGREAAAAKP